MKILYTTYISVLGFAIYVQKSYVVPHTAKQQDTTATKVDVELLHLNI